jgi:uncharacterized delta-60 repeat protein
LILWPASSAAAAPGDLDTSFGGDGKVTTDLTKGTDGALDVAVQANGRIVAVGRASSTNGYGRFAVLRYKANGTLDASFGGDGKVITNFAKREDLANAVAIQDNGKIVAAGGASKSAFDGKFALARYRKNGALDPSFGGDGKVTTNLAEGVESAYDVVIQADGKIIAAGGGDLGEFGLVRYNADGTLDAAFGEDGKVVAAITPDFELLFGVALQPDGKIVAVGSTALDFVLARFNPDGSLDPTFGGDGVVTTNFTSGQDYAKAVVIQDDGKIVVAGDAGYCCEWTSSFGLARYNADGTLDTTFGGDGKVITNFTDGDDAAGDVVIQANGKVVAVGGSGYQGPESPTRIALARYHPDGTLDASFGGDGKVTTKIGEFAHGSAAAIQDDGGIVVAGGCGGVNDRFALVRYKGG